MPKFKSSSGRGQISHPETATPKPQTLLKWIGGFTAVISLILGLYQVTKLFSDVRERERAIAELYKAGKELQNSEDYQSAWLSFEQALKSADEGGQLAKVTGNLDAERRQVRQAQEDLAMEWLRNIRITQGQKFSDILDKLIPVLVRGITGANGVRRADMYAHLGWAYFLKSRDGPVNMDPAQQYKQALDIDPNNPYAHAHWAHWILWRGGNLDEATKHFAIAIASARAIPYVRKIQLAGFRNSRSERTQAEYLRVVNDMYKKNEKIDSRTRNDVYSIYYAALNNPEDFYKLASIVPAIEQISLIRGLFNNDDFDQAKVPNREASIAMLYELAGHRDEALKIWRALRINLRNSSSIIIPLADEAIKRLSQQPGRR